MGGASRPGQRTRTGDRSGWLARALDRLPVPDLAAGQGTAPAGGHRRDRLPDHPTRLVSDPVNVRGHRTSGRRSTLVPRAIAVIGLAGGPLGFASSAGALFGLSPQLSAWGGDRGGAGVRLGDEPGRLADRQGVQRPRATRPAATRPPNGTQPWPRSRTRAARTADSGNVNSWAWSAS